jgi:hypothetical protein
MSCPVSVRLGVYALGAADAAEIVLVESHLAACPGCQAELASLKPLPGLLARVPVHLIRADSADPIQREPAVAGPIAGAASGRARAPEGPVWRWRSAAGVAVAAVLGAVAAFGLARADPGGPAASAPPASVTVSAANPVTHVRITVVLTGTSWGTSIRLQASGLPLNQSCRLIVRSRAGATEVAGTWDAWSTGPVTIPASVGWRPADISSVQVATASRNLVTVSAARPAEPD